MLRFLIPLESVTGETRVAATPETVKKFLSLGCQVSLEKGAGNSAGFIDDSFASVGAEIIEPHDSQNWASADVVLCVQAPQKASITNLSAGALLVGLLEPYSNSSLVSFLLTRSTRGLI